METSSGFSESPDVQGFFPSCVFALARVWVVVTSLGKQISVIGVAKGFGSLWTHRVCLGKILKGATV